jgi:phosphate uptake regulator
MKRKLIKQAGQAVTLTLPIEWIRKNNLKSGDEVDLIIKERDLIISSDKRIKGDSIKLDSTGFPRRMKFIYNNAAYARGIDEIELISEKKCYPNLSQNMGYAVVSQKDNVFKIKDIGGNSTTDLDEIFKRVFQMIIAFYDRAIENLLGEDMESQETIREIDMEINKFALFLQRSIMKMNYPDSEEGKIMFAYSFALEKIGDEVLRLWRTGIEEKIKMNEELKNFVLLSREGLSKSFEVCYRHNSKNVVEFLKMKDKTRRESTKLLDKSSGISKFVTHALRIMEDSWDLTHLSLMKNLKDGKK